MPFHDATVKLPSPIRKKDYGLKTAEEIKNSVCWEKRERPKREQKV